MPCDTIQINSVVFDISKLNQKLLVAAMLDAGAQKAEIRNNIATLIKDGTRYTISNGTLQTTASDAGEMADAIKRAYSVQVLKLAAHQNGWTLQQTGPLAYNVLRT